jgi:outer membrane protein assembly factor BamB
LRARPLLLAIVAGLVAGCANGEERPPGKELRGALYALDAATGALRWKMETGFNNNDVLLSGDTLFMTEVAETSSELGSVYVRAVETTSGRVRWRAHLRDESRPEEMIVTDENVYVVAGPYDDDALFALDRRSGRELWHFDGDDVLFELASTGGLVYVAAPNQDAMYAFDGRTGEERWRFSTEGGSVFAVRLVDETLVVLSGLAIFELEPTSGQVLWRKELWPDFQVDDLAGIGNGAAYLLGSPPRGGTGFPLLAIDLASGSELWQVEYPVIDVNAFTAGGGGVYFLGSGGIEQPSFLTALDADTGSELWRHSGSAGPPLLADSLVLAPGSRLWAIAARSGAVPWSITTRGRPLDPPAVDERAAYLGTSLAKSGIVVAVDLRTGRELWEFATARPVAYSPVSNGTTVFVPTTDLPYG